MDSSEPNLTALTVEIVSAYVVHNTLVRDQLPAIIGSVYGALSKASSLSSEPVREELKPAVPVRKSVTDSYIICLEDGKKFKSLKRHLRTHYGLSPEEYREKWGLPYDYPMVAPAYAAARSELAKTMGLGRRRTGKGGAPSGAAAAGSKAAAKGGRAGSRGPRK